MKLDIFKIIQCKYFDIFKLNELLHIFKNSGDVHMLCLKSQIMHALYISNTQFEKKIGNNKIFH